MDKGRLTYSNTIENCYVIKTSPIAESVLLTFHQAGYYLLHLIFSLLQKNGLYLLPLQYHRIDSFGAYSQ